MACVANTPTVQLTVDTGVLSADAVVSPDVNNALEARANGLFVSGQNETGWFDAGETWTYLGADAPTFTITVQGDKTAKYSAGQRVKLTQGSVKYFIIVAVSYDGGTSLTTLTLYGGTDYTLVAAAITTPQYSTSKGPTGFPLSPAKWSVTLIDAADRTQAGAVANTWYNPAALSITLPIGSWNVDFVVGLAATTAGVILQAALSILNNASTDADLVGTGGAGAGFYGHTSKLKTLDLAAKTVYYLLLRTTSAGTPAITFPGSTGEESIVRARCAYL